MVNLQQGRICKTNTCWAPILVEPDTVFSIEKKKSKQSGGQDLHHSEHEEMTFVLVIKFGVRIKYKNTNKLKVTD